MIEKIIERVVFVLAAFGGVGVIGWYIWVFGTKIAENVTLYPSVVGTAVSWLGVPLLFAVAITSVAICCGANKWLKERK